MESPATPPKKAFWTGWILSILPVLLLLFSAAMKLAHPPQLDEGFAHLRVGDPYYTHLILGVVLWAGLYLREPRLRALIPLRAS